MKSMYRISELAAICGVSPRTVDYYTRRGLLWPTERSTGGQRHYDEQAIQRLHLIKEMQTERLTLREITTRLTAASDATATGLAATIQAVEEELDRLNRRMTELAPQVELANSPDERRAVAQVAGLALSKALLLAQWLATLTREGQGGPLA